MQHGQFSGNVYRKKENENMKLRMGGGSWSINLDEVPKAAEVVEYVTPQRTYQIRTEDAFAHGFIRILGGERKLIVPLKYWHTV